MRPILALFAALLLSSPSTTPGAMEVPSPALRPIATPTRTPTATPTATPLHALRSPTPCPSDTPSLTPTPSPTPSPTAGPGPTRIPATDTPSPTPTPSPTDTPSPSPSPTPSPTPTPVISFGLGIVQCAAYSADGTRIAVGSTYGVHVHSATTGQLLGTFGDSVVTSVAFSPDGQRLLTVEVDADSPWGHPISQVVLRDAAGGDILNTYMSTVGLDKGWASFPTTVVFTGGGSQAIVGTGYENYSGAYPPLEHGTRYHQINKVDAWSGTLLDWADSEECNSCLPGEEWFRVFDVSSSDDGQQVVLGVVDNGHTDPGRVLLWDFATVCDCLPPGMTPLIQFPGHRGRISPDGNMIATIGLDCPTQNTCERTLKLWNAITGEMMREYTGHFGDLTGDVVFSADGTQLAAGSRQGFRLWNTTTAAATRFNPGKKSPVQVIGFSPDKSRVLATSLDAKVRVYSAQTGSQLANAGDYSNRMDEAIFSTDGSLFITAGGRGYSPWGWGSGEFGAWAWGGQDPALWRPTNEDVSLSVEPDGFGGWGSNWGLKPAGFEGPPLMDDQAAWDDGYSATVNYWSTTTRTQVRSFTPLSPSDSGRLLALAVSPEGSEFAALDSELNDILRWDGVTGRPLQSLVGLPTHASSLLYAPDGKHLVSGNDDGRVRYWDTQSARLVRTFPGGSPVLGMSISDDGQRLLSCGLAFGSRATGTDGCSGDVCYPVATLWDLGTCASTLLSNEPPASGSTWWFWGGMHLQALSPSGGTALLAGPAPDLRDVSNGQRSTTLTALGSVSFARDGRHVVGTRGFADASAIGVRPKAVAIDTHSGYTIERPPVRGRDFPIGVALSPDGSTLVSVQPAGRAEPWSSGLPAPLPIETPAPPLPAVTIPEAPVGVECFRFQAGIGDWDFRHVYPVFDPPTPGYEPGKGIVTMTATNHNQTFGWLESPQLAQPERQCERTLVGARWQLVSNQTSRTRVPQIRLRSSASNSQQTDMTTIESNGDAAFSPVASGTVRTTWWYAAPSSPLFGLELDLLNFDPGDASMGSVGLDEVTLMALPNDPLSGGRIEREYTFDQGPEGFTFHALPDVFSAAEGSWSAQRGALAMRMTPVTTGGFEFSWWGSPDSGNIIEPEPGRIYSIDFTIESDQANCTLVPGFRLRVNESQFRLSQQVIVASTGDGANSPTEGAPRTYTVVLPEGVGVGGHLILSFDSFMAEGDGDATAGTLWLTNLVVRSSPALKTLDDPPEVEMAPIPAGRFQMGNAGRWDERDIPSDVIHPVDLSPFEIGKYEVTNSQFATVMNWALRHGYLELENEDGRQAFTKVYLKTSLHERRLLFDTAAGNIEYAGGQFQSRRWSCSTGTRSATNDPAVAMTRWGALAFCNFLSIMNGLPVAYDMRTGMLIDADPATPAQDYPDGFRLPTEAEWERAAAWGGDYHYAYGCTSDELVDIYQANHTKEAPMNPMADIGGAKTTPVGWFDGVNISPHGQVQTVSGVSPSGTYDMTGNVAEWCYLTPWATTSALATDPILPATGAMPEGNMYLGLRGGSWAWTRWKCLNIYRAQFPAGSTEDDQCHYDFVGLRVARGGPTQPVLKR